MKRPARAEVAGPLVGRWREEAKVLRHRGAPGQADALESCAAELEEFEQERALKALTLDQAASESGYSYSALEKMIRRGELLNVGERGSPRVRRGDLPRKSTKPQPQALGIPDIANQVLSGRALA